MDAEQMVLGTLTHLITLPPPKTQKWKTFFRSDHTPRLNSCPSSRFSTELDVSSRRSKHPPFGRLRDPSSSGCPRDLEQGSRNGAAHCPTFRYGEGIVPCQIQRMLTQRSVEDTFFR